jgi:hypothetical protein
MKEKVVSRMTHRFLKYINEYRAVLVTEMGNKSGEPGFGRDRSGVVREEKRSQGQFGIC